MDNEIDFLIASPLRRRSQGSRCVNPVERSLKLSVKRKHFEADFRYVFLAKLYIVIENFAKNHP